MTEKIVRTSSQNRNPSASAGRELLLKFPMRMILFVSMVIGDAPKACMLWQVCAPNLPGLLEAS